MFALFITVSAQSSQLWSTAEGLGGGTREIPFSTAFRPALGTTQSFVILVTEAISSEVKQPLYAT
jgi:hypothetical protein